MPIFTKTKQKKKEIPTIPIEKEFSRTHKTKKELGTIQIVAFLLLLIVVCIVLLAFFSYKLGLVNGWNVAVGCQQLTNSTL